MSKIFDSIKVYGSGTTNSSSTLDTYDSSGTTTFTIKDGGNVGIGTNSPTEKLFVSGKTYISESLGIGSSAPGSGISLGSTYPIYFGNANHNIYNSGDSLFVNGWSYLTLNASTAVGISTNNINRLYVNSIGNVGIGTSTPLTTLHVNGKATIQGDVDVFGNVNVIGTATTLNTETVQTRDNKILLNYSGTNVTAVGGGISVLSANTIYTSGLTELITDINGDWNSNVGLNITGRTSDNSSNGLTVKNSGNTDLLTIKNNGIHTFNSILDGESSGNNNFIFSTTSGGIRTGYYGNIGYGSLFDYFTNNVLGSQTQEYSGYYITKVKNFWSVRTLLDNKSHLFMDGSTGYIGIGDDGFSPTSSLHIKGQDSSQSNYGLKVQNSGGTDNLVVRNDGNVGVGESSPTAKLSVLTPDNLVTSYGIKVRQNVTGDDLFFIKGNGDSAFTQRTRLGIGDLPSATYRVNIQGQSGAIPTDKILGVYNFGGSLIGLVVTENTNVGVGKQNQTPTARLHVEGINTLSSDYALKVDNSASTSLFYVRNDGNVGIGTNSPTAKLEVNGDSIINSLVIGRGGGNSIFNVALGNNTLYNNTGGTRNTSIGYYSNNSNIIGNGNTSIGYETLKNNNGDDNTAIGSDVLIFNTSGNSNVGIGRYSLYNNTIGTNNVAIGGGSGSGTLYTNTNGNQNIAIGGYSLQNQNGVSGSVAIGWATLYLNTSGVGNVAVGHESLRISTDNNNTALGHQAGKTHTTGGNNTFIGNGTDSTTTGITNSTAIGYNTKISQSNTLILGDNVNVGIGTSIPSEKLEVSGKTKTTTLQVTSGATTGYILTSDSSGNGAWQAPVRSMTYLLGHDSVSPTDSNTYYIGSLFVLAPVTSSQDSRRVTVQRSGTITDVGIMTTIGGTLGSGELSTFTINNVTSGTSSTITTGATHSGDSNINYTLSSPLTVTKNDKIEVRWVTPVWATNPTAVRQMINVVLSY